MTQILPCLKKIINFDAVLVGNIGYVVQQEVAKVCLKQGIPYLVLHKEGLTIPGTDLAKAKLYATYQFVGSKILLYNDAIKQALLDVGVPGITKDNARVVGIPRFDYYFEKNNQALASQKQIAFFPSILLINSFY